MFGDCQVLSTLGGNNAVSSDSFYSSSPIHNPNFSFMSNLPFSIFPPLIPKDENGMITKSKEEMESGSGSEQVVEGASGNEQEAEEQLQQHGPPTKKKRYHRHTARQIQEMEALFKECPHPDDKQRLKLSQELGLKPRQVKFWFQNRRTQMKAQHDRADNVVLRAENENLKNENYRLQAALRNIICPNCGSPPMLGEMGFDEQELRLENARLREEFQRVCMMVTEYSGRPLQAIGPTTSLLPPSLDLDVSIFPRKFGTPLPDCSDIINVPFIPETSNFAGGVVILEGEKSLAMELAITALDELVRMCRMGKPLWTSSNDGKEVLNMEEYTKLFPWPVEQKPTLRNFRTEATRHSALVIMNSSTLIEAFTDANKWTELFPCIVSRAKTLQVVNSDVGGHANGSLHLMYAEQQVVSPLVPSREAHFLRFFHHIAEENIWAVVDFPVDGFQNCYSPSFPYYKRRPSGCIIKDMPNGYSEVTWVEHVEVEENRVHQIFDQFVASGCAFGAPRWLAVLQRQCERFASLMARNISNVGVIPTHEARTNLMNLAQRMIRSFSLNMSTSCGQSWTALSDSAEDTVRITTRKVTESGEPNGLILTAVSTSWLPFNHHEVFDLLRDERRRSQLDILSNGNSLHEVAHIANGSHPGNCISLLRINVASNSSHGVELMLQESCTDESGSLVVYTTVDVDAIQLAMSGEDLSCIPLLPLGFVIQPVPHANQYNTSSIPNDIQNPHPNENGGAPRESGCLLTVGVQVLASTIPSAKLNLSSVTAVNNHLCSTVQQIVAVLGDARNILTNNDDMIPASPPVPHAPSLQDDQILAP